MAKRAKPITLADIAKSAKQAGTPKETGKGAPASYSSWNPNVAISRDQLEEWICGCVWVYLLQGVKERAADRLPTKDGEKASWRNSVFYLVSEKTRESRHKRPVSQGGPPPLAPGGVRRIWDSSWRKHAHALIDATDWIHAHGGRIAKRISRPTMLKMLAALAIVKAAPVTAGSFKFPRYGKDERETMRREHRFLGLR